MTIFPLDRSDTPTHESPRSFVLRRWIKELLLFGGVGGIAFVVDTVGFNLLRATVLPHAVVWAKVCSVVIAMVVAWVGHRYLTYRNRSKNGVAREAVLFVVANLAGLLVAAGCLFVSHDLLGLTSVLADNIAANVVGLVLGTGVRFLLYRHLVFRHPEGELL